MNRDLLTRPFEPHQIKQRPGQHGKVLHYVDVTAVIQRLNEALERWDFSVESHQLLDGEVVVLGKLSADGVVKMAFGGSSVTIDKTGQVVSLADDLKSAASDALKKAASMLGVGLELYGGSSPTALESQGFASQDAKVTSRQLAALHSTARNRGLSRDALTHFATERTGAPDLAHLTKTQASNLISELSGSNGASR